MAYSIKIPLLLFICLLPAGCNLQKAVSAPTIEFTKIPKAAEGGPDKIDNLEGRVSGARNGQKIVLYAKSGIWWVQPFANQPFTDIQPDSTWKNTTHYGTEYAALLTEPDYQPPARMDNLPAVGDKIIAISTTKGEDSPAETAKTLQFSGYEWKIRTTASDRGATKNNFDPANAWTDENGFLHLRIAKNSDQWTCAEVSLTRSLGYGSYNFVVRDTSQMEPAAVLSMFTWDDAEAGQNHREMNIEISRWGDLSNKNLQFVIQPYYVPANVARFDLPPGVLTHSFQWQPGRVTFRTVRGKNPEKPSSVVAEHIFTSGVPAPEGESVHLNLFIFGYGKIPLQKETEVVIEKFEYLP